EDLTARQRRLNHALLFRIELLDAEPARGEVDLARRPRRCMVRRRRGSDTGGLRAVVAPASASASPPMSGRSSGMDGGSLGPGRGGRRRFGVGSLVFLVRHEI